MNDALGSTRLSEVMRFDPTLGGTGELVMLGTILVVLLVLWLLGVVTAHTMGGLVHVLLVVVVIIILVRLVSGRRLF